MGAPTLKEAVMALPVNRRGVRRLVVWDWETIPLKPVADIEATFARWQYANTRADENLSKVLWFEVTGEALGVVQAKAIVQWWEIGILMRHVGEFTDHLRSNYGYDGGQPVIDHVRLRHGGSGEKRWQLAP